MRLNIFKYGIFTLFLCVFVAVTLVKLPFAKNDDQKIVVNTNVLNEESKNINFNLKYPEVKLSNAHIQNKINIQIKEDIYEFKKYIEDVYKESESIFSDELNAIPFKYEGFSSFEYEVVDNVLSLRLTLTHFTGGAHPMTFIKEYNFDLSSGNVLKLSDIFNKDETYNMVIDNFIRDKFKENPENYFVDEFKGVTKDTEYYLTKDNLVIFFQLYEIAPYSAGIPEFKIPYSNFGNSLKLKV